jgi:hypothetical protein
MSLRRGLIRGVWALALAAIWTMPAAPLTMQRADLDKLVAGNGIIVVARVEAGSAYWNRDASFILTDFRLTVTDVLKGKAARELSLTLMGGTAGEYTTLIPGGAELIPGQSYVLFLRQEALPGIDAVMTVAEHSQGVFDIVDRNGVQWAVSQAAGEALIPDEEDEEGDTDVPGGAEGMKLADLQRSIAALVEQQSGGGVR